MLFVKHWQTLVLHFSSRNHVVDILFVTFVACFCLSPHFIHRSCLCSSGNIIFIMSDFIYITPTHSFHSTQTTPTNTYAVWACDCGSKVSSVLQQVIFPGTDGSAAAAAPWLRTRRGHRSACRSPLLLCWVESPPTPPCLPSYRTEGSGNLAERDTDAYTQSHRWINTHAQ